MRGVNIALQLPSIHNIGWLQFLEHDAFLCVDGILGEWIGLGIFRALDLEALA
jgi:hypothetical protein